MAGDQVQLASKARVGWKIINDGVEWECHGFVGCVVCWMLKVCFRPYMGWSKPLLHDIGRSPREPFKDQICLPRTSMRRWFAHAVLVAEVTVLFGVYPSHVTVSSRMFANAKVTSVRQICVFGSVWELLTCWNIGLGHLSVFDKQLLMWNALNFDPYTFDIIW